MKKKTIPLLIITVCILTLSGCCQHEWKEATCTSPKMCSLCEKTEGEILDHDWVPADCENPMICSRCGDILGDSLGHNWREADCVTPRACTACEKTEGEALGHAWKDASCVTPKTCTICGDAEGEALGHSWRDADCENPKTCTSCGSTEGTTSEHNWLEATYIEPKTCALCGTSEGEPLSANNIYPEGTPRYADGRYIMRAEEILALYILDLKENGYDFIYTGKTSLSEYYSVYSLENSSGNMITVQIATDPDTEQIYYVSAICKLDKANAYAKDYVMSAVDLIFATCHGSMDAEKWDYISNNLIKSTNSYGEPVSKCICDELEYMSVAGAQHYEVAAIADASLFE